MRILVHSRDILGLEGISTFCPPAELLGFRVLAHFAPRLSLVLTLLADLNIFLIYILGKMSQKLK